MVFVGFNLTFFPQFVAGYLGMPRRYHAYPDEFQVLNVASTLGASILSVGYVLPMIYFTWSIFAGEKSPADPWGAQGLEWEIPSPPPTENFYEYADRHARHASVRPQQGGRHCLRVDRRTPSTIRDRCTSRRCTSRGRAHADVHVAHHPKLQHHFDDMAQQAEASTLGMWVFLVTEIMFFGGLFMCYLVYRTASPEGFAEASHHLNVYVGRASTPSS